MTTMLNRPVCILDLKAKLGEGPYWSSRDNCLYFVDILGHKLHAYQAQEEKLKSWEAPSHSAFILPVSDGSFIIGQEEGLYRFNPQKDDFSLMYKLEDKARGTRLNDGCIDRAGRLWFGTMDMLEEEAKGAIYCLESQRGDLSLRKVDVGYTVSNGPAISPDGTVLYVADSPQQLIYAFHLDEQGALSQKRVFARLEHGYPDGLVTDLQGNLWCGVWGGGRIARFNSEGKKLPSIDMPASNVTKISFGGDDYRTVYVTTARNGLSREALLKEPEAGGLFMFRTDIAGWEQSCFPAF